MPLDKAIEETVGLCYGNVGVFGKTFMPESFSQPYRSPHKAIIDALNSEHKKIVIAAPRGMGKTTFVKAFVASQILYRERHCIGYVSQSETLAMVQTENIKRELLTNREIKRIFGNIRVDVDDPEMDEQFSKHSWVAFGDTIVVPRGAQQQVRGFIFKNYRWDLFVVDDFENRMELQNPENRKRDKEWFYADFIRSVDRYTDNYRIIYIDTVKHSESLIAELLCDPDWHSIRLEAFDDNYKSTIPELYSDEEIKKEVESARRTGTLDILHMELRNVIVAPETRTFKMEYFKYYEEKDIAGLDLENIVIVDPAKTAQMNSADTAIVGIGVDYIRGALYIRDIISAKLMPDAIIREAFSMALRLRAFAMGVEVTGLEEFIKQPFLDYMRSKGVKYALELVWLKARGGDPGGDRGKIKRIRSLQPYYKMGFIYHNKNNCTKLESQLFNFPGSGLVDIADAESYILEMFGIGGRNFQTLPDEYEEINPADELPDVDEYDELEYEPVLDGWRIA